MQKYTLVPNMPLLYQMSFKDKEDTDESY